jgi:hypothetical protein
VPEVVLIEGFYCIHLFYILYVINWEIHVVYNQPLLKEEVVKTDYHVS